MSSTPPLPPIIGRTERAFGALMGRVLARTGGTFHHWVILNLTAANGETIDRSKLIAGLTDALQTDETAAAAAITELTAGGLLAVSGTVVSLSDAGRERYLGIRATIDETTASLSVDIPADDLATVHRVLTTMSERASAQLAQA
jgi:phosphatidylethanolamine-binding protein (PEBP) family uncharacterized protein